ncbi:MAG: glycosyltransferase family 2 protein [Planctomycetota bacterium]|jgi:glycosyltransferase involved in cell wall biosynthesis
MSPSDHPADPRENPALSLVIPVHDEEANLVPLWEEVTALLDGLEPKAEVLFVNDGSTDASSRILDRLRAADPRVRVIDHDRNHGLTAALNTGFRHARGDVVGMLDADLQNPPAEIAKLLDALPGVDMVIGWRRDRNDPWVKRVSSRIANAYRNWRTREKVHDTACGLKVFRREILDRVKLFDGMHRFLPTLARMEGFRIAEVPVAHRPRHGGRSHYGVWNRIWKGLRDVRAVRWMWKNRLVPVPTERPPVGDESAR